MRAYLPVAWSQLELLQADDVLPGPHWACAVPPAWRTEDPQVDEEQWEFEAQSAAAGRLGARDGGVVLAVDVDDDHALSNDGWLTLTEAVRRATVAAVLTEDLAWYGIQEIGDLLAQR